MKIKKGDIVFLKDDELETPHEVLAVGKSSLFLRNEYENVQFVTTTDSVIDHVSMDEEEYDLGEYEKMNLFLFDVVEDIADSSKLLEDLKNNGGEVIVHSSTLEGNFTIIVRYERNTNT